MNIAITMYHDILLTRSTWTSLIPHLPSSKLKCKNWFITLLQPNKNCLNTQAILIASTFLTFSNQAVSNTSSLCLNSGALFHWQLAIFSLNVVTMQSFPGTPPWKWGTSQYRCHLGNQKFQPVSELFQILFKQMSAISLPSDVVNTVGLPAPNFLTFPCKLLCGVLGVKPYFFAAWVDNPSSLWVSESVF